MNYFFIAVSAYFLSALVTVIDKLLLKRAIPSPIVYSFYSGLLSFFAIIFLPFAGLPSSMFLLILSFLAGFLFLAGLLFLFTALNKEEVSRVWTGIGSLAPIFVFILAFLILGEKLNFREIVAFLVLLAGGFWYLLSRQPAVSKIRASVIKMIVLAAFFLALSFVVSKYIFEQGESFWIGFVWIRLGSFLAAFLLLIPVKTRQLILKTGKKVETGNGLLLVGNKALAGISFVMLNLAISEGSVTLVNALEGMKFIFIFILAAILSVWFPKILKEEMRKEIALQKIIAIILISLGLIILYL